MPSRFSPQRSTRFERPVPSGRAANDASLAGAWPEPDPPPRPRRPEKTPLENNEYAGFAAQLSARSERLRAGMSSPEPPPPTPNTTNPPLPEPLPEAPRDRYSLSRLANERPARLWAGGLLLASLTVGVLAGAWSVTRQPASAPAPAVKPVDLANLERSRLTAVADALRDVVPPPVSTPALPKELWRSDPSPQARDPWLPPAPSPASTAADRTPLNQDEIRELQGRLKAVGLDPGPIDGVVGPRTTAALQKYGAARALANPEPTKVVLARLRAEPAQSAQLSQR
jgi:hypothetical protein